jgi:hypothetical protein
MSDEKIILKAQNRGGFDMSFNNLESFSSVKIVINEITFPIFKEKRTALVGVKEFLDDRDVIELGIYKKLYRVVRLHRRDIKKGNIYQIKRVDGASITQFDIDATAKGQKFKIKNRKSYKQLFEDFDLFKEEE